MTEGAGAASKHTGGNACEEQSQTEENTAPSRFKCTLNSTPLPAILTVILSAYIIVDKSALLHRYPLIGERNGFIDPITSASSKIWAKPDGAAQDATSWSFADIHTEPPASTEADMLESASWRKLSGTSHTTPHTTSNNHTSNTTHTAHAAHAGHHTHAHEVLIYFLIIISIGVLIAYIATVVEGIQETVVLFILGVIYSFTIAALPKTGALERSYNEWTTVNPHLLLFVMLPCLLAGDAMTIDTSIARRVSRQCLYLAGPGVGFGAFATAGFLYAYFSGKWSFQLCVALGAILAATDPVAVVGLLKELGASPTLTVQIQGESLLNDGTAIVMFNVAYGMLKGESYDVSKCILALVQSGVFAIALGWLLGWVTVLWMRLTHSRFEHKASNIQISLTICNAYWAFFLAEGVLHWSGVLCTVASCLVLADRMWPAIVHKHSMHHVWHMLEFLGNTIIFFLAGSLTGKTMRKMDPVDYLHLIVIYLVCMLIRCMLIFGSRPILSALAWDNSKVSWEDCAVMTWGGLRGAVGLCLAMQVAEERAKGKIPEDQAERVLFFTGGVATLTLLINATTCPGLVRYLGITKAPAARKRLLKDIHRQLQTKSLNSKYQNPAVAKIITELVDKSGTEVANTSVRAPSRLTERRLKMYSDKQVPISELMAEMESLKEKLDQQPPGLIQLIGKLPEESHTEILDTLRGSTLLDSTQVEPAMLAAVNEVFISIVRSFYEDMIERDEFVLGTREVKSLLNSTSVALSNPIGGLIDLQYLCTELEISLDDQETISNSSMEVTEEIDFLMHSNIRQIGQRLSQDIEAFETQAAKAWKSGSSAFCKWFSNSIPFNFLIIFSIILNAILWMVESASIKTTNEAGTTKTGWLVVEVVFAVIFTFEAFVKIVAYKTKYFQDNWNRFDFLLVLLAYVGIITNFLAVDVFSKEARLLRFNKVFRVLRLLRVVRLVRLIWMVVGVCTNQKVSLLLAEHIEVLTILRGFMRAHLHAQNALITFLGDQGEVSNVEEARCIIESKVMVLRAKWLCIKELRVLDKGVVRGMNYLKESSECTEELIEFVQQAEHVGVLAGGEAEKLLHPLEDHEKKVQKIFTDETFGIRRKEVEEIGSQRGSRIEETPQAEEGGKALTVPREGSPNSADAITTKQAPFHTSKVKEQPIACVIDRL